MVDLTERFWSDLLDHIEGKNVIPVIGMELVTIREDDRELPLYRWLAQRLAADFELPAADLPESFNLNDVVALHLRRRGKREELYSHIHRMLRQAALAPPEPLLALAGISGLSVFVSLTFDSLLADALDTARNGRGPQAEPIVYHPRKKRDLPVPKADLQKPVVFHLLGKASALPDYAICDEDLLEFMHGLQDKQRQPEKLFDALRENHLLILGCSFGDWLARFFLRIARNVALSQPRQRWDWLVGDHLAYDNGLVLFLESFSSDARVISSNAVQFVTELARRWQAAHPEARDADPVQEADATRRTVPSGAIFVSYASEDLEVAGRLTEGLRSAGLEVWIDRHSLGLGEAWERSIKRAIKGCALFLPVVSRQSLSPRNDRRNFWLEWRFADEIAAGRAPDSRFIVPVIIDETIGIPDLEPLPDSFTERSFIVAPDGKVTSDVARQFEELVRDYHRRQRGT